HTYTYSLSLHDALPIWYWVRVQRRSFRSPAMVVVPFNVPTRYHVTASVLNQAGVYPHEGLPRRRGGVDRQKRRVLREAPARAEGDRKSTRLNSSHDQIS